MRKTGWVLFPRYQLRKLRLRQGERLDLRSCSWSEAEQNPSGPLSPNLLRSSLSPATSPRDFRHSAGLKGRKSPCVWCMEAGPQSWRGEELTADSEKREDLLGDGGGSNMDRKLREGVKF